VTFTERARQDVLEILQYTLARWGSLQRDAYATRIDEALVQLSAFPELGTARPDLAPDLRIHPMGEHVIFYQVYPGEIRVLRIGHNRQIMLFSE
jgi:toxin ParE1/3/4